MRTNPHRCRRRTRRRRAGAIVMQLMEIVLAHSLSRHNDTVIPLPRWREGRPQQRAGSLHDPAGSQESPAGIVRLLWPLVAWGICEVCSPGCGGEADLDGTQVERGRSEDR